MHDWNSRKRGRLRWMKFFTAPIIVQPVCSVRLRANGTFTVALARVRVCVCVHALHNRICCRLTNWCFYAMVHFLVCSLLRCFSQSHGSCFFLGLAFASPAGMCAPSFWPSKVGVVRDWKYIILVWWVRYYIPREVVKKAGNLRVTCNCDKTPKSFEWCKR